MRTVEFSIPDLAEELARAATHLPPRPEPAKLCPATGYPPRICGCADHQELRARELSSVLRGIAGI
jgi:hypothetical protein